MGPHRLSLFQTYINVNYFFNLFCGLDVDECKERMACQCPDCKCKNTWGGFDCSCRGDLLYMKEHDTCIGEFLSLETGMTPISEE